MGADRIASNIFVTDAPLAYDDLRLDRLGRGWFAEQVARRIAQASGGDSVVFGLAGPWGSGKTSTLAQIRKALDGQPEEWVIVDFTPWATTSELALAEEFYNTIASALDGVSGKDAAKVKKMLNAAGPALAAGAKALFIGLLDKGLGDGTSENVIRAAMESGIESIGEYKFDEDPFAKRFNLISEHLEKIDINVLVVVDDVDRLHRDELLAVMKAVRLLGRFNGVHYLLSYDTQTVTDVLTGTDIAGGNRRRAQQYLEKIVQYPFQLPPIQDVHLAGVIDELLRELSERYGYGTERSERDLEILLARLPLAYINLRTIYRLFAQVDMMLVLITQEDLNARPCDEIDLLDAILLTYLRLEHNDLYGNLPPMKSDLTHRAGAAVDVEKDRERGKKLLTSLAKPVDSRDNTEGDQQRGLAVLRALFPDAVPRVDDGYRALPIQREFQIRNSDYFDRYFAFSFPVNDIRDARIRADLVEVVETGALPAESVLNEHANDRVTGTLLRNKIREGLRSALLQATDRSRFGEAARTLTRLASEQERRQPHLRAWWAVVTFELWKEFQNASETGSIHSALSDYINEFGIDMTAVAVHVGGLGPESPIWNSTEVLWDLVQHEYVAAIFDEGHSSQEPNSVQQLAYWLENHPTLHLRVQEAIERHILDRESVDLVGMAASFVYVTTDIGHGRKQIGVPNIGTFQTLFPRANWPTDQLPTIVSTEVDVYDLSYENRRRLASNALLEYLGTQPSV